MYIIFSYCFFCFISFCCLQILVFDLWYKIWFFEFYFRESLATVVVALADVCWHLAMYAREWTKYTSKICLFFSCSSNDCWDRYWRRDLENILLCIVVIVSGHPNENKTGQFKSISYLDRVNQTNVLDAILEVPAYWTEGKKCHEKWIGRESGLFSSTLVAGEKYSSRKYLLGCCQVIHCARL